MAQPMTLIGFGQVVFQQVTVVDTICSLIELLSPTVSDSLKEESATLLASIRRYGTALQTAPNKSDAAALRAVYGLVTSAPVNDLMEASSLKSEVVKLREEIAGLHKHIAKYEEDKKNAAEKYDSDKKAMQDTIDSLQAKAVSTHAFICLREILVVMNSGIKSTVGKRVSLLNLEQVVHFADFVYEVGRRLESHLRTSAADGHLQAVSKYTRMSLKEASSQRAELVKEFQSLFNVSDTARYEEMLAGALHDKKSKKLLQINGNGFTNAKRLLVLLRTHGVKCSVKTLANKIFACRNDSAHLLENKDRELTYVEILADVKLAISLRPDEATTEEQTKETLLSTDESAVLAIVAAVDELLICKEKPLLPRNFNTDMVDRLPVVGAGEHVDD